MNITSPFATRRSGVTLRTAYVQQDVPDQLIQCAALIDFGAYTPEEMRKDIARLRGVINEKLPRYLVKRQPNERTNAYREIPAHIPDDMLAVFNDYKYPALNGVQLATYKMALTVWIKTNLKTIK